MKRYKVEAYETVVLHRVYYVEAETPEAAAAKAVARKTVRERTIKNLGPVDRRVEKVTELKPEKSQ